MRAKLLSVRSASRRTPGQRVSGHAQRAAERAGHGGTLHLPLGAVLQGALSCNPAMPNAQHHLSRGRPSQRRGARVPLGGVRRARRHSPAPWVSLNPRYGSRGAKGHQIASLFATPHPAAPRIVVTGNLQAVLHSGRSGVMTCPQPQPLSRSRIQRCSRTHSHAGHPLSDPPGSRSARSLRPGGCHLPEGHHQVCSGLRWRQAGGGARWPGPLHAARLPVLLQRRTGSDARCLWTAVCREQQMQTGSRQWVARTARMSAARCAHLARHRVQRHGARRNRGHRRPH